MKFDPCDNFVATKLTRAQTRALRRYARRKNTTVSQVLRDGAMALIARDDQLEARESA